MSQTRSFMVAAIAACSLLLAASFGVAAHESASSGSPASVREAAAQLAPRAQASTESAPNRAPLAIVGLGSLAAGAYLLRRAPKLV